MDEVCLPSLNSSRTSYSGNRMWKGSYKLLWADFTVCSSHKDRIGCSIIFELILIMSSRWFLFCRVMEWNQQVKDNVITFSTSDLLTKDFNFLTSYCLWWRFFRISSVFEENCSQIFVLLHNLHWPPLYDGRSFHTTPLLQSWRAELWCCAWLESRDRRTVSSSESNFTMWQFGWADLQSSV